MKRTFAVCIAIAACVSTSAFGTLSFTTTLSETQPPGSPAGVFSITDTATFSEDPLVGILRGVVEDPDGKVQSIENVQTSSGLLEYTSPLS